jgi:signal transduction histidine kinase
MIWLHVGSDTLIALAYFIISSGLAYLVYKAREDIPFQWMFLAFGLFIVACGATHLMAIITVWRPFYWFAGEIKLMTAAASIATAAALPRVFPQIFGLISTAKASEGRKRRLEVAHRELKEAHLQLRELDELKSQFFANVSHELRTPLALILGPLQKLLNSAHLASEQKCSLEVAHRNALILLRQVDDLLDASKLEAGKMALHYAETDLAHLVRLTLSRFETLASDRNIELRMQTPSTLPAQVDPEKVERILTNLLSNAFKFVPDGGKVRCELRSENTSALLVVADSGPGVPVEKRKIIFERFRQAEGGATRCFGGTGLGLFIAKDFIELHQGTIGVDEAPEGGALFLVTIPLKAPSEASVDAEQPSPSLEEETLLADTQRAVLALSGSRGIEPTEKPLLRAHAPRVLVVEDNWEMNRFVTDLLASEYYVASAMDGVEGLNKAREELPDLILTDIMMPRMSGDQLIDALRTEPVFQAIPILLLTAKADDEQRIKLLREGAQDYVTKPFSVEELQARVRNLLAMKIARDKLEEANRELQTFAYSVSHDLRAPLRTITGYASMLLEDYGTHLAGDVQNYLKRIITASLTMDKLVQDVLAYSRVVHSELTMEKVDLQRLISQIIQTDSTLQEAKASIVVQGPLMSVQGNESYLSQCLANLLANAVKFVPPRVKPQVKIWTERKNTWTRLWVQDNGIGIAPHQQEQIFCMFERLHSKKEYEGTGIGLALVKKAVTRMGGKVGVISSPGTGSRFWIQLRSTEDV